MAGKYTSFFCPKILIDSYYMVQDRWTGDKNVAKVLFLSVTYLLQNPDEYQPKSVYIDSGIDMERKNIKITDAQNKGIEEFIQRFDIDKSHMYLYAFSHYLDMLEEIINELLGSIIATEIRSSKSKIDEVIIAENIIHKMIPDSSLHKHFILKRYQMGPKVLCVVDKNKIYKVKISMLFKDDEFSPKKAYANFFNKF